MFEFLKKVSFRETKVVSRFGLVSFCETKVVSSQNLTKFGVFSFVTWFQGIGNLFSGNLEKITACVFKNIALRHLAVIFEF